MSQSQVSTSCEPHNNVENYVKLYRPGSKHLYRAICAQCGRFIGHGDDRRDIVKKGKPNTERWLPLFD